MVTGMTRATYLDFRPISARRQAARRGPSASQTTPRMHSLRAYAPSTYRTGRRKLCCSRQSSSPVLLKDGRALCPAKPRTGPATPCGEGQSRWWGIRQTGISYSIRHTAPLFTIIWLFCKGNGVVSQMWCPTLWRRTIALKNATTSAFAWKSGHPKRMKSRSSLRQRRANSRPAKPKKSKKSKRQKVKNKKSNTD